MKRFISNLKRCSIVLVCMMLVVNSGQSVLATEEKKQENIPNDTGLTLYAQAAVLMDADSGRILYAKNAESQMAMASTTKIMTLLVALENGNPEDMVTVSAYAASRPKVKLYMREGEQYRLGDLYYALMLESYNDVAVAIAEHIGGSVEGFAKLMNEKAAELGCENTYFITPNGLDATEEVVLENGEIVEMAHSTTAAELAKILSFCVTDFKYKEEFLKITRTASYSFCNGTGSRSFTCTNKNSFLNMMDGALTGKTGFTNKAGYCYAGALERDGKTFVVALLACGWPNNKNYKWSDTKKMMQYGLDSFYYQSFEEVKLPSHAFDPVFVAGAKTEEIGGAAYTEVILVEDEEQLEGILLKSGELIEAICYREIALQAPVMAGQEVGYISYQLNGEEWRRISIEVAENVEKADFEWCFWKVMEVFILSGCKCLHRFVKI